MNSLEQAIKAVQRKPERLSQYALLVAFPSLFTPKYRFLTTFTPFPYVERLSILLHFVSLWTNWHMTLRPYFLLTTTRNTYVELTTADQLQVLFDPSTNAPLSATSLGRTEASQHTLSLNIARRFPQDPKKPQLGTLALRGMSSHMTPLVSRFFGSYVLNHVEIHLENGI